MRLNSPICLWGNSHAPAGTGLLYEGFYPGFMVAVVSVTPGCQVCSEHWDGIDPFPEQLTLSIGMESTHPLNNGP